MLAFLLIAVLAVAIIVGTSVLRLHPFLVLLAAAFAAAFAGGLPVERIPGLIGEGFGGVMAQIGLVIVLGTIIGVILERSGAAVAMAHAILRVLGERFPGLAMSLIGYVVSIPVFCDSGYVILNSLKTAMARAARVSTVGMSVALATGLYASHSLVPPTPGPLAAASALGLQDLGLFIIVGAPVALVAALAGWAWAGRFMTPGPDEPVDDDADKAHGAETIAMPSTFAAFFPILLPILLICAGSVAASPLQPFGSGDVARVVAFLGHPVIALSAGLIAALPLLRGSDRKGLLNAHTGDALAIAAPILLITGAGGALGAVLRASPMADQLAQSLIALNLGLFGPFILAAALKTAQGSTTVAIVTVSAMIAPLAAPLGLDSSMGLVLLALVIGAGAMTVSHANDSFFWVVAQLSRMSVATAYRTMTIATLIQGVTAFLVIQMLSLALL